MITFDCRYEFEFSGGHLPNAFNTPSPFELWEHIFEKQHPMCSLVAKKEHDTIFVFHCEHSKNRAPNMCSYLRKCDRNSNTYPKLHYPNAYVLHRGYKFFYHWLKRLLQCHHHLKNPNQPMEDCILINSEDLKIESDHLEKNLKNEDFVEQIAELEKLGVDLGDKSNNLIQELRHLSYIPMGHAHYAEECSKQASEADGKWKQLQTNAKKPMQKSLSCNNLKKGSFLKPKTGSFRFLEAIAANDMDDQ